jgi:predicted ferric reductase
MALVDCWLERRWLTHVNLHRMGQCFCMVCGFFMYMYCMIGKTIWSNKYLYGPIIRFLSSVLLDPKYSSDKAIVPLFTIVLPTLCAGTVASLLVLASPTTVTTTTATTTVDIDVTAFHRTSTTAANGAPTLDRHHRNMVQRPRPHTSSWWRTAVIDGIQTARRKSSCCCPSSLGDGNMHQVSIWMIVVPSLVSVIINIVQKIQKYDSVGTDVPTTSRGMSNNALVSDIANVFAIMALWAMALLLIPVSRYSYILQLFHWTENPVKAIVIHQYIGYTVMIGVASHVSLHIYRWYSIQNESIFSMLFNIPSPCLMLWNHTTTSSSMDVSMLCQNPNTSTPSDCTCYGRIRNVTGLVATIALLCITSTTIWPMIRRKWYTLFYVVHRIAGPIVFLAVVLHWNRSIIYLAGGILYYVACTIPVGVEQYYTRKNYYQQNGVRIVAMERVGTSDDCIRRRFVPSLTNPTSRCVLAVTFDVTNEATQLFRPGQYIKLCVPSISMVAHPFTINQVVTETTTTSSSSSNRLRIIFRCVGPFTCALGNQLTQASNLPIVHMEGFYGPSHRFEQVMRHDTVVVVAGGIGITPYLTLLHDVISRCRYNAQMQQQQQYNGTPVRKITLYWICRDPSLIEYIQREYLHPIMNFEHTNTDHSMVQLQIIIHQTGNHHSTAMVSSYSNFDRNPDKQDNNNDDDDVKMVHDYQQGAPFTTSKFFPGSRQSYKVNVASFLAFALIAWIGLASIWYLYSRWQSKDTTLPRLIAPILILVIALAVSRGAYWLVAESSLHIFGRGRIIRQSSNNVCIKAVSVPHSGWSRIRTHDDEDGNDSDHNEVENIIVKSSLTKSLSLELSVVNCADAESLSQLDNSCNIDRVPTDDLWMPCDDTVNRKPVSCCSSIETRYGRPTVHQFLNSLDEGRKPGLFACGPSSLLRDIRKATKERCLQRLQQCRRCEPSIALYEESFEI